MVKICGPKLAIFGIIVSVWGMVQLFVMGFLFKYKSVALFEDLQIKQILEMEVPITSEDFYKEADRRYEDKAMQCWIAALIYLATLAFSYYQYRVNYIINALRNGYQLQQ